MKTLTLLTASIIFYSGLATADMGPTSDISANDLALAKERALSSCKSESYSLTPKQRQDCINDVHTSYQALSSLSAEELEEVRSQLKSQINAIPSGIPSVRQNFRDLPFLAKLGWGVGASVLAPGALVGFLVAAATPPDSSFLASFKDSAQRTLAAGTRIINTGEDELKLLKAGSFYVFTTKALKAIDEDVEDIVKILVLFGAATVFFYLGEQGYYVIGGALVGAGMVQELAIP